MCLKRSGYITEVHHVDGDGEDAGVVYCEMQSHENSGESRTHLAMLRAMYPGSCGYKCETGGIMHNLRTSTSHDKVSTSSAFIVSTLEMQWRHYVVTNIEASAHFSWKQGQSK